jgi:hypothetical protein
LPLRNYLLLCQNLPSPAPCIRKEYVNNSSIKRFNDL